MISKTSKIFITGHNGLVGRALVKKLHRLGFTKIITANRLKLDLRDQAKVFKFFKKHKPNYVINAAAKVVGIYSNNKYPADFSI